MSIENVCCDSTSCTKILLWYPCSRSCNGSLCTKLLSSTRMYIPTICGSSSKLSSQDVMQVISLKSHRVRITSGRLNRGTVQAKQNHLRIEPTIGVRLWRALSETVLLPVQLARLRLRIPRVGRRIGFNSRSFAWDRASELSGGVFQSARG